MNIYFKLYTNIKIYGSEFIFLKDIAEIYSNENFSRELEELILYDFKNKKDGPYLITSLDVIKKICKHDPNISVCSLGANDCIVDYQKEKEEENTFLNYVKIALVSIILFTGSCVAIMSFHADSEIPLIFKNIYYLFFNEKIENPYIIDIPYSFGIAIGIIMFFNQFSTKKNKLDPTPIEIELYNYEKKITETKVDELNLKRRKEK